MLYLHYYNDYGDQTLQGGSIQCRAAFNKITTFFNYVDLQGNMTNSVLCISTTTRPVGIKLCKVGIYYKGLPPTKLGSSLNT